MTTQLTHPLPTLRMSFARVPELTHSLYVELIYDGREKRKKEGEREFLTKKMLSGEAQDTLRLVRELRILEEADLRSLEQLFANRPHDAIVSSLIRGREALISKALFRVATGASSTLVVGYVLRFLADLTQVAPLIAKEFGAEGVALQYSGIEPAATFMNLAATHEGSIGISGPALHLVGSTLRHAAGEPSRFQGTLTRFFQFCSARMNGVNGATVEVELAVHALSQIVRRKALREYCFGESSVAALLPKVITEACEASDSASLIQTIYEALLCTWMLSFESRGLVELTEAKLIPTVHRVLQKLQKEKCVRLALMTLKNFGIAQQRYYAWRTPEGSAAASADPQFHLLGNINRGKGPSFFADMIGVGINKTLWQLARRKFGDEDILAEVEELTALLDQNLDAITSFSEYKGEVQSGMLEWSPVHSSIKFWKENAGKFEENGYEVLKDLASLVMNSRNDLTLAIACHDIGELVRHHPTGRALLQLPQLRGVKERVMQHMSHQNSEVSKNALLAVQKIMVQKWEFIK